MSKKRPTGALEWEGGPGGHLKLVDQTRLPRQLRYIRCRNEREVWRAIKSLQVRGAPAIGIAAAYGVYLGVRDYRRPSFEGFLRRVDRSCEYLGTSRPTAVNLFWALERMHRRVCELRPVGRGGGRVELARIKRALLEEAHLVLAEDRETCLRIGRNGAPLLRSGKAVLTHCNTGGLATGGFGTAHAVITEAFRRGKRLRVYADETRPLLQGARLTTWEFQRDGVPVTLICDNMAASVIRDRKVGGVVTGADRIAANGDTANKIGTYGLALLARAHRIPFYVAAPLSTIDLGLPSGKQIPIEQRAPEEVTHPRGVPIAPRGTEVFNPAFDVTPARMISALITEVGVLRPPYRRSIRQAFRKAAGR